MKEVDEWRQIGVADVILALRHGHTSSPTVKMVLTVNKERLK